MKNFKLFLCLFFVAISSKFFYAQAYDEIINIGDTYNAFAVKTDGILTELFAFADDDVDGTVLEISPVNSNLYKIVVAKPWNKVGAHTNLVVHVKKGSKIANYYYKYTHGWDWYEVVDIGYDFIKLKDIEDD